MGTVYNMMRDHEKAQEYFLAAQQVAGHDEPDKNDLWNMGIATGRRVGMGMALGDWPGSTRKCGRIV